jgi:hypothetical protein
MSDKAKKIIKWCGIGAIAAGAVAVYFGGGSETEATAVVGGAFVIIGIVAAFIKVD